MRGIDPRTSRMLSERSTIWATSPLRKRAANDIWSLSSVNALVEQSPLLPIVVLLALDAGHQSMCFSHATRLPSRLTCLAGGFHMSCLCQTDVFDCLISGVYVSFDVFLRWTLAIRGTNRSLSKLYCFRCFLLHIGRTNPCILLV